MGRILWLFFCGAALALADQPGETLPGFRAENVLESHGIDNVNLFNGDPGLVIPLGPEYTLGPSYRWQLNAYSSAKFWAMGNCDLDQTRFAFVRGDPTIGVGWTLHLGYIRTLYYVTNPTIAIAATYISPDGGEHNLDFKSGTVATTLDGTHLRVTVSPSFVQPAQYTVEFPDGSIQFFNHSYSPPKAAPENVSLDFSSQGSPTRAPEVRFGLSSVRDSFRNTALSVAYDASRPEQITRIVLTPSTQPRTIVLSWKPGGYAVGAATWQVLDHIDFPAPSSQTLRATFGFQDAMFLRNGYDISAGSQCGPESSNSVALPQLTSISFIDPGPSPSFSPMSYAFSYFPDASPSGTQCQGAIQKITLPTGGTIQYDYGVTTGTCVVPSCDPNTDAAVATADFSAAAAGSPLQRFGTFLDNSPAVRTRTQFDPATGQSAVTTYERVQYLVPRTAPPYDYDTNRIFRRTTVTAPGNDAGGPAQYAVRYYFHVAISTVSNDGGIELERRLYPGADTAASPIRSVISCWSGKCSYHDASGAIVAYYLTELPPKQAEVTWFGAAPAGSDGGTCSATLSPKCSSWVGSTLETTAGRYKDVTMTSTLTPMSGWSSRKTSTNWTPQSGSLWDLELFSSKQVTDVGTALPAPTSVQTNYSFDPADAFLNNSSVTDATYGSLTHTFTSDSVGNARTETLQGTGQVSTTAFTDTQTFLVGSTQGFLPVIVQRTSPTGIGWRSFDVDRETNTGLVTAAREPNASLVTAYSYDALGRLRTIAAPDNELATTVAYVSPTQTTVTRGTGSAGTWQDFRYDGFGRLVREIRRIATTQFAVRIRKYDRAGHAYFLSQWGNCTSGVGDCLTASPVGTTQSNFDPFGRAQTIRQSDGSTSSISFSDGSLLFSDSLKTVSVSNVGGTCSSGSCTGGVSAVTIYRYDPLGRLISVTEPSVGGSADVTSYAYNVLNKVAKVTQGSQTRTFAYDSFGLLRSETTPEKGTVTYGTYDALGNVVSETQPGALAVARVFDAAGRLQRVTADGRVYVRNCYDGQSSCVDGVAGFAGGSNPKGKLTRRYGYNPLSTPSSTVTDDFDYSGLGGRPFSRRTTVGPGVLARVTQAWYYNNLGLVAQHNHARPSGAAPLVVSTAYGYGLPVSQRINGISMVKGVAYHPGGAVKSFTTGIGVGADLSVAVDQDAPSLMPRPSKISATLQGIFTPLFSTGAYTYDGEGNPVSIGSDTYGYDSRSRLAAATLSGFGSQAYAYDRYGNLLSKGSSSFPVAVATNHLTGATYDARGNLTGSGGDTYGFDGLDRLISHTPSGFKYLYDGVGERQVKAPPAGDWTYTFRDEGERVATEFSGSNWSRDNVYLGNLLVASYANGAVSGNGPAWTFYTSDHLGSPRFVTDVTGNSVESRRYWPYGEDATPHAPFQRIRFAAMERDTEGGNQESRYHDHARSHQAVLGRFIAVDLSYGDSEDPQSLNRYAYASSNPLKYIDSTGLATVCNESNTDCHVTVDASPPQLSAQLSEGTLAFFSRDFSRTLAKAADNLAFSLLRPYLSLVTGSNNDPRQFALDVGSIALMAAPIKVPGEGLLPSGISSTFRGVYRSRVLKSTVTAYRYSGGESFTRGRFLTTIQTVRRVAGSAEARSMLNLPKGNSAEVLTPWTIPAGTRIFVGRVEGGGARATQIFIEDSGVLRPLQ